MADKVSLGFEVTGLQQAKSDVDSMAQSLQSLWAGTEHRERRKYPRFSSTTRRHTLQYPQHVQWTW